MVVVALVGFVTIADDVRHSGEFFAVLGILLSGFAILASRLVPKLQPLLALQWTGAGILGGLLVGALLDRVALGLAIGIAFGLVLAYLYRGRDSVDTEDST